MNAGWDQWLENDSLLAFRGQVMLEAKWAEGLFRAAMDGKLESYDCYARRDREAMMALNHQPNRSDE